MTVLATIFGVSLFLLLLAVGGTLLYRPSPSSPYEGGLIEILASVFGFFFLMVIGLWGAVISGVGMLSWWLFS